jgi:hypothetical protein
VGAILRQCADEQSAFWGWSTSTWRRLLGATQRDFRATHPAWVDRQVRHYLIALPYLLHCLTDLRLLGNYKRVLLAEKIFGPVLVQTIVARVAGVLAGWGYQDAHTGRAFPRTLCEALLHNRSPRLEDLTPALLDDLRSTAGREKRSLFHQLQRALAVLGVMDAPPAAVVPRPTVQGVPTRWQEWAERWESTSTLAPGTRRHVRLCVLQAGRWLTREHPTVEDPAAWTRELCAAYVAAADRWRIGDFAQRRDPSVIDSGILYPRARRKHTSARCGNSSVTRKSGAGYLAAGDRRRCLGEAALGRAPLGADGPRAERALGLLLPHRAGTSGWR